jgi:hypothetical protein
MLGHLQRGAIHFSVPERPFTLDEMLEIDRASGWLQRYDTFCGRIIFFNMKHNLQLRDTF